MIKPFTGLERLNEECLANICKRANTERTQVIFPIEAEFCYMVIGT